MTTVNDAIDRDTSDQKPHPGRRMTEEEFVEWCDEDTQAEWIEGEVIIMAPESDAHADLNGWLYILVRSFVEDRDLGVVRGPRTQIRIGPKRQRREPDLLFVAGIRRDIIRKNHVEGAPDLIVEIVSPDSVTRDWRDKFHAYAAAGVREYWVVDLLHKRLDVYRLGDNGYEVIPETDGVVRSAVLPGFFIRPKWLWQEPLPKVAEALGELGVQR